MVSARSTSLSEARMVVVRSDRDHEVDVVGQRRLQVGQQRLHLVDRLDDVGVGLQVDDHQHRALAVGLALVADVLGGVDHLGDVAQPHRRAVAPGDDQRPVFRGRARLVVGVDLPALVADLDRALGRVGVGRGEGGAHALEADPVLGQRGRVDLDPHRRQRAAAQRHLADAGDLAQLLLQHVGGGVVEAALAQRVRGERQDQHRRVGRVDLAVLRVAAQVGRQVGARGVDRGLHVARRAVDRARQVELQGDARIADRAGRGDLGDAGDRAQPALERRRHAGRHRVGRGAGQRGLHRDRREVDLGQRRHRQLHEAHDAGQQHAQRQQRRRHRPGDERGREVHHGGSSGSSPGAARLRRASG